MLIKPEVKCAKCKTVFIFKAKYISLDESIKAVYADDLILICECGSKELYLSEID